MYDESPYYLWPRCNIISKELNCRCRKPMFHSGNCYDEIGSLKITIISSQISSDRTDEVFDYYIKENDLFEFKISSFNRDNLKKIYLSRLKLHEFQEVNFDKFNPVRFNIFTDLYRSTK